MIYNKEFLNQLDNAQNKTIFARITALNWAEEPLETIEGRVTQGSINIDGQSAVRRTCSATIVAQDYNVNNYYWGLNTKFKLAIGVENTIDTINYPSIIWFEQGIYVLTSFNMSYTTNNFTISLQGKDKMCLLNGDVGGNLESSVDFGQIEEENNDGIWTIRKIPIKEIIMNAVHIYGREPYHNIIIKDLDTYGVELLEYRHEIPMYLYGTELRKYDNMIMENSSVKFAYNENDNESYLLSQVDSDYLYNLVNGMFPATNPKQVYNNGKAYYLTKIQYGETAGYRNTELTYAGDLIANIGDSLTSVLDKIRNMLVEFEYFYDIEGRFVFQKKQSFTESFWKGTSQEELADSVALGMSVVYKFTNNNLITAFNNNPNLLNVKNDYSIWGEREGISGAKIPIHFRYAIDQKPIQYKQITVDENDKEEIEAYNQKHNTNISYQETPITFQYEPAYEGAYQNDVTRVLCDWREVIYRMAVDYYKYNWLSNFEQKVAQNNSNLYPTGQTGYEKYYIDLEGFWRQIFQPNEDSTEKQECLIKDYSMYNFWIDFLDTTGELQQFSVKNIGHRSKVINDTNVKSIFYRETPSILYADTPPETGMGGGYFYIQVPNEKEMFTISAQGKSAEDRLKELLYQHGYCSESVSITSIPIYYLEPNTRIYISDNKTGIEGEYIVSKLTIPLAYNGTMSITATKAAETII